MTFLISAKPLTFINTSLSLSILQYGSVTASVQAIIVQGLHHYGYTFMRMEVLVLFFYSNAMVIYMSFPTQFLLFSWSKQTPHLIFFFFYVCFMNPSPDSVGQSYSLRSHWCQFNFLFSSPWKWFSSEFGANCFIILKL